MGGQLTRRQFPASAGAETSSAAPSTDAAPAFQDKFTLLPLRAAEKPIGALGHTTRSVQQFFLTLYPPFVGNFVGNFVEYSSDSSSNSTKFPTKFPTTASAGDKMRTAVPEPAVG